MSGSTDFNNRDCIDKLYLQDGFSVVWLGFNISACCKRYNKERRRFGRSYTLVFYKIWFQMHRVRRQCKSLSRVYCRTVIPVAGDD